jgi:hypothetical protein
MTGSSLVAVFNRIAANEAFDGSHVSLDREHRGEMTVNIAPNWLDNAALSFLVTLAREMELSLALTKDGIRLDEQTGHTVRGVQAVKDVLSGREGADDAD